ncbi:MAG: hypothetical protein IPK31_07090 [Chitinophagaceae bacterium]|nr:hypothetical protein [Chitinophagaceae bacterium]
MQQLFIIGGTTFDHIVYLPQLPQPIPQTIHQAAFHEGTGSTGSGKALNLHRLAVPLQLYSVLGNDSYGIHSNDLRRAGVDAFMITILQEQKGISISWMQKEDGFQCL